MVTTEPWDLQEYGVISRTSGAIGGTIDASDATGMANGANGIVGKILINISFLLCQPKRSKRPLKNRQTKVLEAQGSLMKVKSIAECSLGAFCNIFDLH